MEFKRRTLNQIADMICGNFPEETSFFPYQSSKYLTEFFEDIETDYRHDGSTRQWWVAEALQEILTEPQPGPRRLCDLGATLLSDLSGCGSCPRPTATGVRVQRDTGGPVA